MRLHDVVIISAKTNLMLRYYPTVTCVLNFALSLFVIRHSVSLDMFRPLLWRH